MKKVKFEAKLAVLRIPVRNMSYNIFMPITPNPKTQQYLGRKLRELREQKEKTQQEVADSIGIDVSYYAGIERAEKNPSVAILEALCKLYKISSSQILPF